MYLLLWVMYFVVQLVIYVRRVVFWLVVISTTSSLVALLSPSRKMGPGIRLPCGINTGEEFYNNCGHSV